MSEASERTERTLQTYAMFERITSGETDTTVARSVRETLHDYRRVVSSVVATLSTSVYAATGGVRAQAFGGAVDVTCSAGLGPLVSMAIGGVALYIVVKGFVALVMGLDQSKSNSSKKQQQGRSGMRRGAKMMAGGIAIPPLGVAFLSAMGVSLGCLTPGAGLTIVVPVLV